MSRIRGLRPAAKVAAALAVAAVLALLWSSTADAAPGLRPWQRYAPATLALDLVATYALLALAVVLSSRTGVRRRAARVAAVTLALVLSLVVVETPAVVFGHDYQRSLGTLGPEATLGVPIDANRLDPELIHIHHPRSRVAGRARGNLAPMGIPGEPHAFDVSYDARGFRNRGDLERADIAVIGDSFVEAALVALDETLTERLARATGRACVNLGQAAYGPQQELAVLRRFALSLEPTVVVWCFFGGNDVRDTHYYEELRRGYDRLEKRRAAPLPARLFTTNAVRALKAFLVADVLSERARRRSGIFTDATGREGRVFFGKYEHALEPEQLEATRRVLDEAARECEAAGARLLLLYVPRKFRVYDGLCRLEPDSVCRDWVSNDLPEVLRAWCAARGVAFADTTPELRERVRRGEAVYFADDVHWNGAGHAVAAELVARRLRELGWLDGGEEDA